MPGSYIVLKCHNYVMSDRSFELLQLSKVDEDRNLYGKLNYKSALGMEIGRTGK